MQNQIKRSPTYLTSRVLIGDLDDEPSCFRSFKVQKKMLARYVFEVRYARVNISDCQVDGSGRSSITEGGDIARNIGTLLSYRNSNSYH